MTWTDQWYRIARWQDRVRRSRDDGRNDGLGTEGYRDEVFALFQAIWHLKDWLANDVSLPTVDQRSAERWIRASGNMLHVAADIANGSKHMALKNKRAGGSEQSRNSLAVHVGLGVKHTFYITDKRTGTTHEAVALADACLNEWSIFLSQVGLHRP